MNDSRKRLAAVAMMFGLVLLVVVMGLQDQQTTAEPVNQTSVVVKTKGTLFALSSGGKEILLPEDGGSTYVSVFVHSDWRERPEEARLVRWFARTPSLVQIRVRTIWHLYTPDDHTFKQTYSDAALPSILVQQPDGEVVYKGSGENIPATAAGLTRELEAVCDLPRLFNRRPWLRLRPWKRPRPCPDCTPKPEPAPDDEEVDDPDGMPDLASIPDTQEPAKKNKPGSSGFWLLLSLVGVGSAVGATAFKFKTDRG